MREIQDITRGLALVAFATGALAISVGHSLVGRRLIGFAIVLAAAAPVIQAGLSLLQHVDIHAGDVSGIVLALVLAVVALAGLVAFRRSFGRGGQATSQKKRVEPGP